MSDLVIKIVQFTSFNPLFKGASVVIASLLALLFAGFMYWRWKEPLRGGFLVFIGLALVALVFGLYILVFQPAWWQLPY
jgi:hypothetical protein